VTFANFNFFCVVNMRQYLPQVAYVAQRAAHRAIPEMIGVGFSNTVRIAAGPRHLGDLIIGGAFFGRK